MKFRWPEPLERWLNVFFAARKVIFNLNSRSNFRFLLYKPFKLCRLSESLQSLQSLEALPLFETQSIFEVFFSSEILSG